MPSARTPSTAAAPARPAPFGKLATGLAAGAAVLAGLALWNQARARRAERAHPPLGRFLEVDGVRLHHVDHGRGRPVVLLHGNMMLVEEVALSGLLDLVGERYRVVAIDRPGFGRSARTRDRVWTPAAQADLLRAAFRRLGLERPVVVGHSFGTIVALELALRHPEAVGGLVLASGYYFPTARVDVPVLSPPAIPVVGDLLRHTLAPLLGRLSWPATMRLLFGPAPTTPGMDALRELVLRPGQIRSVASDSAIMVPAVAALRRRYAGLRCPLVIVAGAEDRFVDTGLQSGGLHRAVAGSELRVVPGAGHMVHHTDPGAVVAAIDRVASLAVAASGDARPAAA
jgi:pimeloyl-ACP methyl ester carboxylesterase